MAAVMDERIATHGHAPSTPIEDSKNEKTYITIEEDGIELLEGRLDATQDDILEAKAIAETLTLEKLTKILKKVYKLHEGDPNFPFQTMQRIKEYLANDDIQENPEKHEEIIKELKLEAALITDNSPYAMVRAVIDNHDDPNLPVSTVRAWVLGLFFAGFIAFVNQLFSIRLPPISLTGDVAQLLAFPLGKAWARWLPNWHIKIPFLKEPIQLNPGPFNKKEHMVIAIMAGVSIMSPYSNYIFWVQYLPQYFNQPYAKSFSYMIVNNLATHFIGYGLAGIVRRFLVYPSYCVWPSTLVTVALNSALHNEENHAVPGPFKKIWSMSRYRFFMIAFAFMFVWFWVPNYLFLALSTFAWMTWISPNNRELNIMTGMNNGLGLANPLPTFDWNIISFLFDPLMYPSFSIFNFAAGMYIGGIIMLGMWYTNTWGTAHLPINTNRAFTHFGTPYNVSMVVDERGFYDHEKFMAYSFPYLSPGLIVQYFMFFCVYSAVLTHVFLNHRYEVVLGFKSLCRSFWPGKKSKSEEDENNIDVHSRLMSAYKEVPELWYLCITLAALALGITGLAVWPTYTSPAVPLYGVALCLVFIVPVGIITGITGIPISLTVIAEFFGGLMAEGNALALNYFKCYGFITCLQTLTFSSDLKLGHYLKIPPRVTFAAQLGATLLATFVSTAVMVFQMNIENVCTPLAPMKFSCPIVRGFFTSSVLWGTIGPRKTFGADAPYQWLLLGFLLGFVIVVIFWGLRKKFPNVKFFRQVNIVTVLMGGCNWGVFSFSYIWPSVPVAWLSWHFFRNRYLALWSKYNFVLSAAFSAAIAITAVLMFFSVSWTETTVEWWGNTQPYVGCEGLPCLFKPLIPGDRFYPWWNTDKVPAA